jgi:hypothetical protein
MQGWRMPDSTVDIANGVKSGMSIKIVPEPRPASAPSNFMQRIRKYPCQSLELGHSSNVRARQMMMGGSSELCYGLSLLL